MTFTARAAGEMRTGCASSGVGGVQARTFHAAALRQLRYFWPQRVGGGRPRSSRSKAAHVATAAGRAAGSAPTRRWSATSPPRSSGPRSARSRRTTTPSGRGAGRAPPAGLAPADDRAGLRRVRGGQARPRGASTSRTSCCSPSASSTSSPTWPARCARQYRHFVVDEYQDVNPLQQRLLDLWLGDRDDLCVVGDAEPDDLLLHRRHPAATCSASRPATRAPPWCGWSATTARRRRWSGSPTACWRRPPARPRARGSPCVGAAPPGPQPVLAGYADEAAEAAWVAARVKALAAQGMPLREIAVLYRTQRAVRGRSRRRSPRRRCPTSCAAASGSSSGPEVRQAVTLLRGAARAGEGAGVPLPELAREVLRSRAGPRSRRRARAPRASAGSRSRPSSRSPTTVAARDPAGRGCPSSSPSSTSAPPPSTRPRPTA